MVEEGCGTTLLGGALRLEHKRTGLKVGRPCPVGSTHASAKSLTLPQRTCNSGGCTSGYLLRSNEDKPSSMTERREYPSRSRVNANRYTPLWGRGERHTGENTAFLGGARDSRCGAGRRGRRQSTISCTCGKVPREVYQTTERGAKPVISDE